MRALHLKASSKKFQTPSWKKSKEICSFVFMEINAQLLKHLELLFGSIGVILSLFFSLFLLITRKQQPKANFFLFIYLLAFSLRIGKSLFFNYFPIDPEIRNIFLGVLLTIGPSIWFYTKFLFQPSIASYIEIIGKLKSL